MATSQSTTEPVMAESSQSGATTSLLMPVSTDPLTTTSATTSTSASAATTMTPSVSHGVRAVSKSSIRLEVLLTTGQRQTWDFRVPPSGEKPLTVEDVKERIFDTWPSSWPNKPSRPNGMRLLHLGHILTDPTPLAAPPPPEGSTAEQADGITPTTPTASSSTSAKPANAGTTQSGGKAKAAKGNDQQTFSAPVVNRNLPLGKSTVVHLLMQSGSGSDSGGDGQGSGDGAGTKRQGSKRQANRSDATTRDKEPSAAVLPPREQDVDQQQHGAGSSSGGCRCVIC